MFSIAHYPVLQFGIDYQPEVPKAGVGQGDQDQDVFPLAEDVSGSEAFRVDHRHGRDEDQFRVGLPPCHLFRADRRRPVLERMRELRELFDPAEQGT